MSNLADICRECELPRKTRELEEAGDRIAGLVQEVFDMITFDSKLKNAIEDWKKVREESGMSEVLIMPKILIHENEDLKIKNLELLQKVQQLEQAGTRLSNRLIDVLDNIVDESALLDALEKWDKAKEEAE